jgi:hypothetical protein
MECLPTEVVIKILNYLDKIYPVIIAINWINKCSYMLKCREAREIRTRFEKLFGYRLVLDAKYIGTRGIKIIDSDIIIIADGLCYRLKNATWPIALMVDINGEEFCDHIKYCLTETSSITMMDGVEPEDSALFGTPQQRMHFNDIMMAYNTYLDKHINVGIQKIFGQTH